VQQLYARELLADGSGGVGYLLKDRVFNADQFIDAVRRVAAGGTAMDPDVIARLMQSRSRSEPVQRLSPREREVLELMAEGCSNLAIGARLMISDGSVAKHIANIFTKLELAPAEDANRRVMAVLAHLNGTPPQPS
jgi:DNA-binding NarL/FixJ family response regulator